MDSEERVLSAKESRAVQVSCSKGFAWSGTRTSSISSWPTFEHAKGER